MMSEFFTYQAWAILPLAAVLWFGGQLLLTKIAKPYRQKLADGIATLRAEHSLSEAEDDLLRHLWDTAFAARTAPMMVMIYMSSLMMPRHALLYERNAMAEASPNFWGDDRLNDMVEWYFVSILAANPLFGVVCIPLRLAWRIKMALLAKGEEEGVAFSLMPSMETILKV